MDGFLSLMNGLLFEMRTNLSIQLTFLNLKFQPQFPREGIIVSPVCSRSVLSDSLGPCGLAHQVPLFMGFPRQEYLKVGVPENFDSCFALSVWQRLFSVGEDSEMNKVPSVPAFSG